jgi:ribosome assembly protein YihI (activator of Der GTPase)
MDPIRPVGSADRSTPAVKPLTREEREQAARERRRRRERAPRPGGDDRATPGRGSIDVRA